MNRQAFTLIEVLVSLSIFACLLLALTEVLLGGNKIYSAVMDSIELREHARNAMDRIVREVRESSSTTVTVDPDNAGSYILSFRGPRYLVAGVSQPIEYSLSDRKIYREFPPSTSVPIAIDVDQLYFNKSGSQLDILIRTAMTSDGRPIEFTLNQKVRMRNEN